MKLTAIKIIISLSVLAATVSGVFFAYIKLIDRLEEIRTDAISERDAMWKGQLEDIQKVVDIAVDAGKDTVRAELMIEVQEAQNRAIRARSALQREMEKSVVLQEALRVNLPADYIIELCGETPLAECYPENPTH